MSPTRWVLPRASVLTLLALCLGAATASAQFYDPTLRSLDLATGRLARSPRLLGMGGLSLAVPDRDASINLWDFAGIPVGLAGDDTTSTVDFRPGTGTLSSVRSIGGTARDRQNLAARGNQSQLEAVYRSRESGGVFGVIADVSGVRWDRPYNTVVEHRQSVFHPEVTPILGGVVPHVLSGHLAWAAHLRFRAEQVEDQYREVVSNAAGEWIGLNGGQLPPPGEFAPTKVDVNTGAYGVSTAYSMGKSTRFALGLEHENNDILSKNDLSRSASEIHEVRPYWIGRAAWVGRFGQTFEYGVVGTGRTADSEADWRFTASAGVGGDPLTGRGNMLTREERSSALDAHVRWSPGRVTLAGALGTSASKVTVDPPNAGDPTSLNRFINTAFNRPNADSLSLPDSVVHREDKHFGLGWGGGMSVRLGQVVVGAEGGWSRDVLVSTASGSGPRRIRWDVRAGLERPLGKLMRGRVGYQYRSVDEDDYTAGNEYIANAITLGWGFAPAGARWSLESGYQLEFRNQDFGDPGDERQSRQQLAAQLHWGF